MTLPRKSAVERELALAGVDMRAQRERAPVATSEDRKVRRVTHGGYYHFRLVGDVHTLCTQYIGTGSGNGGSATRVCMACQSKAAQMRAVIV